MKKNNSEASEQKYTTIDMPDVKDIPGQENVRPPRIREMEDTTAASDGEEGVGIVDQINEEESDELLSEDTNVSGEERELLDEASGNEIPDSKDVRSARVDKTDGEDLLNESEGGSELGDELDVPGSELDDDNEELGEEDEENNFYSRPD